MEFSSATLFCLQAELVTVRHVPVNVCFCVCVCIHTAELRSSGLASPVHSSLSRKSNASSSGPGVGTIPRTSSMHDLLEHRVAVRMQSMPGTQSAGKTYRSGQFASCPFVFS